MRTSYKLIIFSIVILTIFTTIIGCNKEVLPVLEQKEKLNNDVKAMYEEPRFSHLEKYLREGQPIEENSYVKLLSNVGVDLSKVLKEMSLADFNGSKVKQAVNSNKRKVLMFTWCYCPHCIRELKEEIKEHYNPDDFELILMQLELTDKRDLDDQEIKEAIDYDKQLIKEVYEEEGIEELLDYSIYGRTIDLMDDLGIGSFPSIIYLDENNKVLNVSGYINYEGMKILLCECRDKEL